jgi:Putative transposase
VRCLDDVFRRRSGRPLKGGYPVVVQTHGRNGQYTPHLHILATSGGLDTQANAWVHLDYLPYPMVRKKWQWYVWTMLRHTLKTKEINRLVDLCSTRYPNGFVTNVPKGDVPSRYESLARYLAKYVVSPPISLRRIDGDDGQRVTYHSHAHKSARVERETVEVSTFIGRMIPHVFAKGCKRIRYYGGQATKTFAKMTGRIREALSKSKGGVRGAVKIIARLTYRQRYHQSSGRDPLRCPHGHHEMGLWKIWHPKYGGVYDELEAIKRGKYGSRRAGVPPQRGHRHPLWAPSRGISLPLWGLW